MGALSKVDDSPVSIADFGAQALLIGALVGSFLDDRIIAEEMQMLCRQIQQ
jgi:3'(2'), 5'-bisphosphate nucleotidase